MSTTVVFFFFQAEDGIRDYKVTGVQTCALPICAVGRVLRDCPGDLPWHRVVNASGGISARPRVASMLTQRILLEREGVAFRRGHVVLRNHRWARRRTVLLRGGCG